MPPTSTNPLLNLPAPESEPSDAFNTVVRVDGVVNTVINSDVWSNSILQTAVQTLSQLTDVGTALPFIAPAFAIVKFIIDVEQKAREADAKCNDLLERITFMLSQLNVLKTVPVIDATKRVIDRMCDVLKNAASLIQAYRKQGIIARRLNVGNKERFISCAESINACCQDLMLSLQINQTSQLHVLTRSVPVDPEDQLANKFVTDHGGVDNIKSDPKLVAQFARDLNMKMDDDSLAHINENMTQLLQASQAQLEVSLKQTVSGAVIDGIKGLAAQMLEAEKEQVFKCVQCDKDYRNSTNGPAACSFHRGEYSSWNNSYPCCSTPHPCQYQSHRSAHHCEYPYGSFFERARGILNYVDTVDSWAEVEDTDLMNDHTQKASVGQLLRWVSRGQRLEEPTILIKVGTVWFTEPYFFDTFTANQLKQAVNSNKTLIFRTSPSDSEFAMAEWVLSQKGTIFAVRLTAKAATSKLPHVLICPIDISTCTKPGENIAVSKGGFRTYAPSSPYILPEKVRIGPELNDKPPRPTRTNFKTSTSPALPVILKVASDPPLKANPFAFTDRDIFEGSVSVFNKHPAGSMNPITIASASALFRLIGDPVYLPVMSIKILDTQLPVTIDPRQSCTVRFQVAVPRSEEDAKLEVKWWDRAFIARNQPLRLKLVLQDIEDEEASLVLEHVFTPYRLEKPADTDLDFLYFDNPTIWERYSIRVTKPNDAVITFAGTEVNAKQLRKIVYKSLHSGESEVDLGIGQEKSDGLWEWNVWALVDRPCRKVYAFKVLLKQGKKASKMTFGCLSYVLCPPYDEEDTKPNQTRAITYAVESAALPKLEPYPVQEFLGEDGVDDVAVTTSTATTTSIAAPATGLGAPQVISEDIHLRLVSIDNNLSRIATAVELLVETLTKSGAKLG
jgi:hypothetical protein